MREVAQALQTALRKAGDPGGYAPDPPNTAPEEAKLTELLKRRERLVDIYQDGGLTKEEYFRRRHDLDNQVRETEQAITEKSTQHAAQTERMKMITDFAQIVDHIPAWLQTAETATVRRALSALLEYIRVDGEHVVEVRFR